MKFHWILNPELQLGEIEIHCRELDPDFLKHVEGYKDHLMIRLTNQNIVIRQWEIQAIYTENRQVIIQTRKKKYSVNTRLYELEKQLNDSFLKISQSELINLNEIQSFKKNGIRSIAIELKDHSMFYVARRYVSTVRSQLEERL